MNTLKQLEQSVIVRDPKSRTRYIKLKDKVRKSRIKKLSNFYLYPLLFNFILWVAFGLQFLCLDKETISLGVFSFVVGMFLAGNNKK